MLFVYNEKHIQLLHSIEHRNQMKKYQSLTLELIRIVVILVDFYNEWLHIKISVVYYEYK